MIRVDLPYPDKDLWPNGRPSRFGKAKAIKRGRGWADLATRAAYGARKPVFEPGARIAVRITVTRKAAGPFPDKDNCSAAAKSYLDGIADRLGVNDRLFETPEVHFLPAITGRFVIEIGADA